MTANTLKHAEKTQPHTANDNGHRNNGVVRMATQTSSQTNTNHLNPLGEKIFLDRYALKDGKKETVAVGDTVVVAVDLETGQREIGTITARNGQEEKTSPTMLWTSRLSRCGSRCLLKASILVISV